MAPTHPTMPNMHIILRTCLHENVVPRISFSTRDCVPCTSPIQAKGTARGGNSATMSTTAPFHRQMSYGHHGHSRLEAMSAMMASDAASTSASSRGESLGEAYKGAYYNLSHRGEFRLCVSFCTFLIFRLSVTHWRSAQCVGLETYNCTRRVRHWHATWESNCCRCRVTAQTQISVPR